MQESQGVIKHFFLKTNMELEACTSLGSMFHRRGALLVNEINTKNYWK